ncbi:MAG: Bac-transf domain-containing protein [Shouchella clausii]
MKRFMDIFISIILLVTLSPIMLGATLMILVSLGRPVIFSQVRPGLNSRPFNIYKFRTMSNETDESGKLLPNHMRINRIGKLLRKLSIDELPQLINVLKGDLSLVGPRPLLMEYLSLYNERQARRHEVKPGITGWAQINGRNSISWEEKFELDVWYVDNQSLLLDLKIMCLTVKRVFKREGVNQSDSVSMHKFEGNKE